jgi:CBS domain-containing protein
MEFVGLLKCYGNYGNRRLFYLFLKSQPATQFCTVRIRGLEFTITHSTVVIYLLISKEPYVNRSAARIDEDFSLHRTYIVFRTLGLRHLTVVDAANRVVGIITRKDLMGFNLEERLEQRKRRGYSLTGGVVRLLPSEQVSGCVVGPDQPQGDAAVAAGEPNREAIVTQLRTETSNGTIVAERTVATSGVAAACAIEEGMCSV